MAAATHQRTQQRSLNNRRGALETHHKQLWRGSDERSGRRVVQYRLVINGNDAVVDLQACTLRKTPDALDDGRRTQRVAVDEVQPHWRVGRRLAQRHR